MPVFNRLILSDHGSCMLPEGSIGIIFDRLRGGRTGAIRL